MFKNLSKTSRIWIFQADRTLSVAEGESILSTCKNYVQEWNAHGNQLISDVDFIHHLFLVFAVDESETGASGCSIDSMTRIVKSFAEKFNVSFFDRSLIALKLENEINLLSPAEFRRQFKENNITEDTIVFDNMITSLSELSMWEKKIKDSWHRKLL